MFNLRKYRIRLVQGNETRNPPQRNAGENSKVLVSDYEIAILNPDSDEVRAGDWFSIFTVLQKDIRLMKLPLVGERYTRRNSKILDSELIAKHIE